MYYETRIVLTVSFKSFLIVNFIFFNCKFMLEVPSSYTHTIIFTTSIVHLETYAILVRTKTMVQVSLEVTILVQYNYMTRTEIDCSLGALTVPAMFSSSAVVSWKIADYGMLFFREFI